MASIQKKGDSWYCQFLYRRERHTFTIGKVGDIEAQSVKGKVEYLLMRIKQHLIDLPSGCDIVTFVEFDGKPPGVLPAEAVRDLTLSDLREAYFESQKGKLEETTLAGIRQHFKHLLRILGEKCHIPSLTRADLQKYVDTREDEWIDPEVYRRKRRAKLTHAKRRRKYVRNNGSPKMPELPERAKRHPSAATIKKEIISLRTAWNWARRQLDLTQEFPGGHLDYEKLEEALPFMTWEEAQASIDAGGNPEEVWDSVYLRPHEIMELLEWVRGRPVSPWVYPMFCFAAYTGARRSEMVRAKPSDLNPTRGQVIIREKKRVKKKKTFRTVPIPPFLKEVLTDWMRERANGETLFCKMNGDPITPREAHNYFQRGLRLSKWSVLKGWHLFRHSYISALANEGVDQRIIDDVVGHQTEEQRRRYRHLNPSTKEKAITRVFGSATDAEDIP